MGWYIVEYVFQDGASYVSNVHKSQIECIVDWRETVCIVYCISMS